MLTVSEHRRELASSYRFTLPSHQCLISLAQKTTFQELAELLEMSETEINNIFQSNTRHSSLDAPVHEAEDVAMGDLLEGGDDTDDDVMKDSLRAEIRRVLKSLSPREAEIVNAYFGLDGENGVTIEQIGQKYDLTKERIRQIKERAIKRLQKARYSSALKAYLG